MTTTRELIMLTVDDLVASFLAYDRKEDEELSADDLEQAFQNGVVTVDDVVAQFRRKLVRGLE